MEIKKISQSIVGEFQKIKESESQTSKKESEAVTKSVDAFENAVKDGISIATGGAAMAAGVVGGVVATSTGVGAAVGSGVVAGAGTIASGGAVAAQAGMTTAAAATSALTLAAQTGIAAGTSTAKETLESLKEAKKAEEMEQTKSRIDIERKAAIVNLVGSSVAAAASFGMGAAGTAAGSALEAADDSKKSESEIESKKQSDVDVFKARIRKLLA
jgi:hypothetical protein